MTSFEAQIERLKKAGMKFGTLNLDDYVSDEPEVVEEDPKLNEEFRAEYEAARAAVRQAAAADRAASKAYMAKKMGADERFAIRDALNAALKAADEAEKKLIGE